MVINFLSLRDAACLGACNRYLYKIFENPRHWISRFEREFQMKFVCDDLLKAKSVYKLMKSVWDIRTGSFDLK